MDLYITHFFVQLITIQIRIRPSIDSNVHMGQPGKQNDFSRAL